MKIRIDSEHYEKGGTRYNRVTSILKIVHSEGLEKLRRFKGFEEVDRIFKNAGAIGTLFHSQAENIINGKMTDGALDIMEKKSPEMFSMVFAFKKWFQLSVKEVLICEEPFFDPELQIAGTPDLVYRDHKDKIILCDFKTGSKILPIYRLQLSAYKMMIEKGTKIKIDQRMILQIRPDKFKIEILKNDQKDLSFFIFALQLYREFWGS